VIGSDSYIDDEWVKMGTEVVENGNGNDSMGVKRKWEQESHSCTPLV